MFQIPEIPFVSTTLHPQLRQAIDGKTKPIGSLGTLEKLALQAGAIQQTLHPSLQQPVMVIFAGDHGIARSGVSPYPQEVTYQMVYNFLQGGAAINVFAKQNGMDIQIVDAGVNHDFQDNTALIHSKIGYGTASFLEKSAMTPEACAKALQCGAAIVTHLHANGTNVIGFGEMGIGNTSSAAVIMSKLCELPLRVCAGRGTGLDDEGLERKIHILENAIRQHPSVHRNPFDVLHTFGGYEIAMMCGAMLQAASLGMIMLIDGFITTAALLVASEMAPAVKGYCVFSHVSGESGHQKMLEHLQAEPLLQLGLRLGEGTGAALAYPLVQAAVHFLNEMVSFDTAGVSEKQ